MKAGIYFGKEQIKIRELPLPEVGGHDVLEPLFQRPRHGCGGFHPRSEHGPQGHRRRGIWTRDGFPRGKGRKKCHRFCRGRTGLSLSALCQGRHETRWDHRRFFGIHSHSLTGAAANVDCWLDAAGAESILDDFLRLGKIESRFVSVALNSKPRTIDLLHMAYAQQSIIGSGGYMPEDVQDVQELMASGKWDLERIITHEFPLAEPEQAIRTAGDVDRAGNVVVKIS